MNQEVNKEINQGENRLSLVSTDQEFKSNGEIKNDDDGFEAFWAAYPNTSRRVGKEKCRELWQRAKLQAHAKTIMATLDNMKWSDEWIDDDQRFIPKPFTFLEQEDWDDRARQGVPHMGTSQ